MASRKEIENRLIFRKTSLEALRKAYLTLVDGGVKSYTIGTRSLTRHDLDTLAGEISEAEKKVDELESILRGSGPRKAFAVVPRNW